MKALVTGATGFVGSNLAAALATRGDQVRVLRRPTSRLDALEGVPVEYVVGDILDRDSLATAMEGCQVVFHVAATAHYWRADKETLYRVNVDGTRSVMQAALTAGVERVAHQFGGRPGLSAARYHGRRVAGLSPVTKLVCLRSQQTPGRA
jgi:dihydroflavonol-4-reductase